MLDLATTMRTQHACRYYAPDPVPDSVLYEAVELARFGPQGGNRQPVRLLFVRDATIKQRLAELYAQPWGHYIAALREGEIKAGHAQLPKAMEDADNFARAFAEHPVIMVVCADLAETHPTDTELGRLSVVGGGSIYPIVQNVCLALRAQGVATTITTLLCMFEEEVKELLAIPENLSTVAHVVVGYPAKPFPKKLTRLPVSELAFVETFDQPLERA